MATLAGGSGGLEHRAGGTGDVPGIATWEYKIEFAGFGGDAHGADQYAADGGAFDAAATVGEPAVGRRFVDTAGTTSLPTTAFRSVAPVAAVPQRGCAAGGTWHAETTRGAAPA